jgi:alpha/beta superfamily hydrolase
MKQRSILIVFLFLSLQTDCVLSQVQPVKVNLSSDGYQLNAQIFHSVSEKPVPTFILMHGYPGGEGDPLGLGKKLSASGINVFTFNCRGMWSSEGEFSFDNSMEDIGSAIGFLKRSENMNTYNIDTTNIVVGGWSFGGAMALTAAIYNPEIKRIISIAGADESVFGRKMLTDQNFREMFEKMLKETEYPNGPIKFNFDSSLAWLSNLDKYDQVKHAEFLKNRDILLISGLSDNKVVLEEHILPLYRKLKELDSENIEMVVLNTDHSFKGVREELAEKINSWIQNGTTISDKQMKNLFIGTWKFISLVGENSQGDIFRPYGENFYGRLMYDSHGNMSVFLMRPNRPKFAAGDIYKGTPEEIKIAFENFDAYCGTYTIDKEKGTVTHHIEGSRFPNWEGSDQTRHFKFSNDTLSLGAKIKAQGKDWELKATLVKQ